MRRRCNSNLSKSDCLRACSALHKIFDACSRVNRSSFRWTLVVVRRCGDDDKRSTFLATAPCAIQLLRQNFKISYAFLPQLDQFSLFRSGPIIFLRHVGWSILLRLFLSGPIWQRRFHYSICRERPCGHFESWQTSSHSYTANPQRLVNNLLKYLKRQNSRNMLSHFFFRHRFRVIQTLFFLHVA